MHPIFHERCTLLRSWSRDMEGGMRDCGCERKTNKTTFFEVVFETERDRENRSRGFPRWALMELSLAFAIGDSPPLSLSPSLLGWRVSGRINVRLSAETLATHCNRLRKGVLDRTATPDTRVRYSRTSEWERERERVARHYFDSN